MGLGISGCLHLSVRNFTMAPAKLKESTLESSGKLQVGILFGKAPFASPCGMPTAQGHPKLRNYPVLFSDNHIALDGRPDLNPWLKPPTLFALIGQAKIT